jgi:hypothetical protein
MLIGMNLFGLLRPRARVTAASPEPARYGFTFGIHAGGAAASFTPATDGHLSLTGGAGTGKTVLLRALAEEAASSMDVHIADAWATLNPSEAIHPAGAASFTSTAFGCAEMLEGVREEVSRRRQLCEVAGAGSVDALDNAPRRILVILDDTRHLLSSDHYSPAGDLHAKRRSVEHIAEIARSARVAGVTFVFSSQWSTDQSAIPTGALQWSFSRLVIGSHYGIERSLLAEISGGNNPALRPSTRQALYEPAGHPGALVDIILR